MQNVCTDGAAKTLDFYKRTFSAAETVRVDMPADKIGRAEIIIGDSPIMFADTRDELGRAPQSS